MFRRALFFIVVLICNVAFVGALVPSASSIRTTPQGRFGGPTVLFATDKNKDDDDDDKSRPLVHQILIEYCTGCKWGLRAFWTAQELLSTFRNDGNLGSVTLVPSTTPGRFAVSARRQEERDLTTAVLWDRHEADGFPEMKQLKQLIRDEINPEHFLGHSDSEKRREQDGDDDAKQEEILDFSKDPPQIPNLNLSWADIQGAPSPHVTITYCTGCQWLLRAAYMAQELVSRFGDHEIQAVTLIPSRKPAKGGTLVVTVDGTVVWDRQEQGRFPETKELKRLVRDLLDPERDLGHIDHKGSKAEAMQEMDDDEAKEARKFFGVM